MKRLPSYLIPVRVMGCARTCPICSRVWSPRGSCNCNSTEAVGQWCRDHETLLRVYFGPRDFYTPTGSLYRHLLPLLDAQAIEVVLAAWVQSSRPHTDEEAVALDGKVLRGAGTAEQPAPHLLAFCTHESQETLLQVRESRENQ